MAGAVNPLPYDLLIDSGVTVLACDVIGGPLSAASGIPSPFEAMFGSAQIMQSAITAKMLRARPPDVLIRPPIDGFKALDFLSLPPHPAGCRNSQGRHQAAGGEGAGGTVTVAGAGRLRRRASSVARVPGSAIPSTREGRKMPLECRHDEFRGGVELAARFDSIAIAGQAGLERRDLTPRIAGLQG